MNNPGRIYLVLRWFIRRALSIFCINIEHEPSGLTGQKGPMLLASTHPNSFLDAIIIGSRFSQPVYFLARGDAFRRPLVRKILSGLKMIPIHRLSEGREYLGLNDATFDRCRQILLGNGIVLIFSEGLCVHQDDLRPLKKGTARIVLATIREPGLPSSFRVQPIAITYSSFTRFGKKVVIRFTESIAKSTILTLGENPAMAIGEFNKLLSGKLITGLNLNRSLFTKKKRSGKDVALFILLLVPGLAGWTLHFLLYLPIHSLVKRKTAGTVFYDSVLFGLLLLLYPLYYLIFNGIAFLLLPSFFLRLLIAGMPAWAWIYVRWKKRAVNVFYSNQEG